MQPHRDLHDFGTLFSTATAFAFPPHDSAASRLYDGAAAPGRRAAPHRILQRAFDSFLTWHERTRQRRALGNLSDHMLRDIGLSRADVSMEVDKPFWRP